MTSSGELAIDLRNVAKVYRRKIHALRSIEMRVAPGEIFGLLGPNGAGKSTLVKIMMTIVWPTRAEGTILGRPVGHKPTLGRIGYLPENHRFPKYLTGRQVIEFFAALAHVDRPTRKKKAGELLELVGMTTWADVKITQYSKGMMQRIGLAQAMASDPDLIVLDEPTDGVDPAGRRDIRDALLYLRQRGKTVFINSHQLGELEVVCDRVAILVGGTVARQGTLDELTLTRQFYLFELARRAQSNGDGLLAEVNAALNGPFGAQGTTPAAPVRGTLADQSWCELEGAILRVGRTDPAAVQEILDALRRRDIIVRKMQLARPTLEELFFEAIAASVVAGGGAPGAAVGGRVS